ncbi:MAG TPA: hypothetical protein VNF68_13150 [Candidatus Baltobacteraceae bacterium]|nr:hypothetical protein [Candidatus Baltobacteraceae bacterium]
MGLRVAIFSLCLAFVTASQVSASPGYCEIEIINDSHENVMVQVKFDDGSLAHFVIYAREHPHYVSVFYHGYCHSNAHVTVTGPNQHTLYSAWSHTGSTIRIIPH